MPIEMIAELINAHIKKYDKAIEEQRVNIEVLRMLDNASGADAHRSHRDMERFHTARQALRNLLTEIEG